MSTLASIAAAMREHDRMHAPGSTSCQWQEFVRDCGAEYGVEPWDDAASLVDVETDSDFAEYWRAVAARDYATAALFGDVDPEWLHEVD